MNNLLKELNKLPITDLKVLFAYTNVNTVLELSKTILKEDKAFLTDADLPRAIVSSTLIRTSLLASPTLSIRNTIIFIDNIFRNGTQEQWQHVITQMTQVDSIQSTSVIILYIIAKMCQENNPYLQNKFIELTNRIPYDKLSPKVLASLFSVIVFNITRFESIPEEHVLAIGNKILNQMNNTLILTTSETICQGIDFMYENQDLFKYDAVVGIKPMLLIHLLLKRILEIEQDFIINKLNSENTAKLFLLLNFNDKRKLILVFGKSNINKLIISLEQEPSIEKKRLMIWAHFKEINQFYTSDWGTNYEFFKFIYPNPNFDEIITEFVDIFNQVENERNIPVLTTQQRLEQMRQSRQRAIANIIDENKDKDEEEPKPGDCNNPTDITLNNWTATNQPNIKLVVVNDQLVPKRTLCFKFEELEQILRSNTTMVPWLPKNIAIQIEPMGYGGGPPSKHNPYPEMEFKAVPPENYFVANWQLIQTETVYYYLLPIEKIRIGNIEGIMGVGMIHGQDNYQIYLVVRKDHVEQDTKNYLEKLLLQRPNVILQQETPLEKIKEIYREYLARIVDYNSNGILN